MTGRKLCVMLVDDDESTNELHELVLEEEGCTERIIVFEYAEKALNYLSGKTSNRLYAKPDIVFLDLNMPRMNGWEFLDEYQKLPAELTAGIVVCLLTTSLNPDDKVRGEKHTQLSGYYSKPLTRAIINEVLGRHFADHRGTI